MGRLLRRILRWTLLGVFVAAMVGYYLINNVTHYAPRWHVDPATVERAPHPNDFLAAPPGATAAVPDMDSAIHDEPPEALLARFDEVAREAPRVEVIAGSLDEGMITYMQRSAVIGFPDYITVRAVPVGEGAALIVYSRSRYGQSDLGVNRLRVTDWLAALGQGA